MRWILSLAFVLAGTAAQALDLTIELRTKVPFRVIVARMTGEDRESRESV